MISAFDVIGPAMVGPSSSHTAGAVRIGLVFRAILGEPASQVNIGLHGSFAATGFGHATDRALIAGLLGLPPDDEALKDSPRLAEHQGLLVEVCEIDLGEDAHPNSTRITGISAGGGKHTIIGTSVGGGAIRIVEVDGYPTSFGGDFETLILWHEDKSGFLAKVTALLSCVEANIATIRTSRQSRGTAAITVIELDAPLAPDCLSLLRKVSATRCLRYFDRLP